MIVLPHEKEDPLTEDSTTTECSDYARNKAVVHDKLPKACIVRSITFVGGRARYSKYNPLFQPCRVFSQSLSMDLTRIGILLYRSSIFFHSAFIISFSVPET